MEKKIIDTALINGWCIDADAADHPNYPIKHYTGDDHKRKNWIRPSLQPVNIELLKSTERPFPSAVFGSKCPPKGLSGMLRRFAFKYSENMYRHWLTLLLADRIDTVEGLFGDLFHGRFPRLAKERGWYAIGKYHPALLARKILVRAIVFGAITFLVIYVVNRNYPNNH